MKRELISLVDIYHVPKTCTECGGIMIFKGVGEYHCEDCGFVDYDDYGKVRLYLENHKGANVTQIEAETGVSQKAIRQMLKESRLQVAEGSRTFLRCEMCGKDIRSGQYCPDCEMKIHRSMEEEERKSKKMQGYGQAANNDDGHRRFIREK